MKKWINNLIYFLLGVAVCWLSYQFILTREGHKYTAQYNVCIEVFKRDGYQDYAYCMNKLFGGKSIIIRANR